MRPNFRTATASSGVLAQSPGRPEVTQPRPRQFPTAANVGNLVPRNPQPATGDNMPSPPTRVSWLSHHRIASQGPYLPHAFANGSGRMKHSDCRASEFASWHQGRRPAPRGNLRVAARRTMTVGTLSVDFESLLPRPALLPWSLRSARTLPITADAGPSGFRVCGPSQNRICQFPHAGHQTQMQPTRKVGIETRPFAAILR
jgi:hypothetical protein